MIHMEQVFKVDFFVAKESEYVQAMFERARPYSITADFSAPFCAPEDTVIAKLRWYELGNRISDKQWNDIIQVLEVQRGELDEEYLDRWAVHFGVSDLLQEARSEVLA